MLLKKQRVIEPLLLTRIQAAEALAISPATFRKIVLAGEVKQVILPDGGQRYAVEDLRRWIAAQLEDEGSRETKEGRKPCSTGTSTTEPLTDGFTRSSSAM